MSPEVGSLEDNDEGRLVHMREKKKLYHSDAKGKTSFLKIVFSHNFLRKLHMHNVTYSLGNYESTIRVKRIR